MSLSNRWTKHKSDLKTQRHHSPAMQNAYNKYGLEVFVFEVLEYCKKSDCISREQYYLDLLKPDYNCCKVAGSTRGVAASDFQKARAKEVHKGNQYNKGRVWPAEVVQRRIETRQKNGHPGPMKGKKHTQATKDKLSRAGKGRKNPKLAQRLKRPIFCETNNKFYDSTKSAIADIFQTHGILLLNSNISSHLTFPNKRKHVRGFKFKRVS